MPTWARSWRTRTPWEGGCLEKGSKDKIQALLLIEEHAQDQRFGAQLASLLGRFEPDRLQDVLADAQAALLGLSADPPEPTRNPPATPGCMRLPCGVSTLSGAWCGRDAAEPGLARGETAPGDGHEGPTHAAGA